MWSLACVVLSACSGRTVAATPLNDYQLCQSAIDGVAGASPLPSGLLTAIGIVESGRVTPNSAVVTPWPWSVDIEGSGHSYASKAEAIAAVTAARAQGVTSIDVGCMQVNLKYHPDAFASLETAFEPQANVRYASTLLHVLYGQSGDWLAAIRAYHSANPEFGRPYGERVAAVWAGKSTISARAALQERVEPAGRVRIDAEIDPHHVLAPEFRAQVIEAASFRRARNVALGLVPAVSPSSSGGHGNAIATAAMQALSPPQDRLRRRVVQRG